MTPCTPSFIEALKFWLKLGFISFGGPAGQIAIMHAELVERRRWISDKRFLHALNYCMVLPGPEAQQLATYLGWLMHRTWGGIAAGALFVLPSLFVLVGLSWLYMAHGNSPWVAAVLAGIKPAVVAIVAHAAWRMGSRTLKSRWLWAIALGSFSAMLLKVPFPIILVTAALIGWLGGRYAGAAFSGPAGAHASRPAGGPAMIGDDTPPPEHARFSRGKLLRVIGVGAALWLLPIGALLWALGAQHLFTQMAWFFTKAALLTFGGAYAVLPYVHQAAVEQYGWLSAAQMIDCLALGETTPGPLIMVVAFVAFVAAYAQATFGPDALWLAGAAAACVVTWFTFLPSFVFILAGGPFVESSQNQLRFTAPLTAITAAVVGVIAHLALYFAQAVFWPEAAFNAIALIIAALAAASLFKFKRSVIETLIGSATLGLLLHLAA